MRGLRIPRLDDADLLRGRAHFGDDEHGDGEAVAVFVRATHAHARIVLLNVAPALGVAGVRAAFTMVDLTELRPIPFQAPAPGPAKAPRLWPLARDVVRHVGEPVAVVIGETANAARDGAEAVRVEYEALPVEVSARVAAEQATVSLYRLGDPVAVEAAFASAPHCVAVRVHNNRLAPAPMEPNVSRAIWHGDRPCLVTGVQAPHAARELMAGVLGLDAMALRVRVPRFGGGFGGRILPGREESVLLAAARRLGRPLRWCAERSEVFLCAPHARDHDSDVEGAFAEDGRLLALRTRVFVNLGAYPTPFGIPIATSTGHRIVDGPYRIPAIDVSVACVLTNTVPTGPYRGAGRPEVVHRIERLLDVAAAQLGIGRAEIRRRNLVPAAAMPYRNNAGQVYDSGDYGAILDAALAAADWSGFAERRQQAEARGRLRGRGLCCHIDTTSGLYPHETVAARLTPEGRFEFLSGTQEMGQSLVDTYRALAASVFAVAVARINIVQGDTARVASGVGSYGSRSLYVGGSALQQAAAALRGKLVVEIARLLGDVPDAITLDDTGARARSTNATLSWSDIAARADPSALDASATFSAPFNFPNGCYVAEVEIEPDTGRIDVVAFLGVDDVGTVLNHEVVHAQTQGGAVQGLGQALLEDCCFGTDGQLLAGSFLDYAMPRANDAPWVVSILDERYPSPTNPLGAKGAGESGAVGAPPAIVSAVIDALRPFGVTHLDMPIRPEQVWRAIRGLS
jgi:aerobic carbon-monoxide dehydrogenase large subunit